MGDLMGVTQRKSRAAPFVSDPDFTLYVGDVRDVLASLPDESVQCVVTSPPYWGLRDYGVDGQLGLEATPEAYVENMVTVFREVRRVLRSDGTCWLNMGDAFDSKQLIGIPWRLAFALQGDGWWLRSEIIWSKPNPMPESVTDRPTKSHEQVFLLTRSSRYFYDADAVREPLETWAEVNGEMVNKSGGQGNRRYGAAVNRPKGSELTGNMAEGRRISVNPAGRNLRSVWEIPTQPFAEAHFATYPQALVERCVKSGSAEGDVVLDPFLGSGTTALVARRLGRHSIGIELNEQYADMAARRLSQQSLLAEIA